MEFLEKQILEFIIIVHVLKLKIEIKYSNRKDRKDPSTNSRDKIYYMLNV